MTIFAFSSARALLLGFGIIMALAGQARCQEPGEASRETIIQGVRDDVRQKIREQQNVPAGQPTVGAASEPQARHRAEPHTDSHSEKIKSPE